MTSLDFTKLRKNLADIFELTLKLNVIVSIETILFLAKFWRVPVKNACGKKNPDIQNIWKTRKIYNRIVNNYIYYIYNKYLELIGIYVHVIFAKC